jgi:hypothetical protein
VKYQGYFLKNHPFTAMPGPMAGLDLLFRPISFNWVIFDQIGLNYRSILSKVGVLVPIWSSMAGLDLLFRPISFRWSIIDQIGLNCTLALQTT